MNIEQGTLNNEGVLHGRGKGPQRHKDSKGHKETKGLRKYTLVEGRLESLKLIFSLCHPEPVEGWLEVKN